MELDAYHKILRSCEQILSTRERQQLALALLETDWDTLHYPMLVDKSWHEEIAKRVDSMDSTTADTMSWAETREGLKKKFRWVK